MAPSGKGLLHKSWWYRRSVALCASGSRPDASVLKSNEVSIRIRRPFERPSSGADTRRDERGSTPVTQAQV